MQLHNIKPSSRLRKKPRVGRGGKRGTYSGRGQKGQKARAGRRIRPVERDLLIKFPKLRGYKHGSFRQKPVIVKISDLNKVNSGTLDVKSLLAAGLVTKTGLRKAKGAVKILGDGETAKKFKVDSSLMLSRSAKEKLHV